jgi:hypothetical protein
MVKVVQIAGRNLQPHPCAAQMVLMVMEEGEEAEGDP